MPQTLLALLALVVASILSLSQQRSRIQSYDVRLRDEYSVAASGMVMQAMELIAARPFDEASTPASIEARDLDPLVLDAIPTTADFTPRLSTEFGRTGSDTCNILEPWKAGDVCDDLDDYHTPRWFPDSLAWQPVEVALSNGHAIPFEVRVEVDYVTGAETGHVVTLDPTDSKRVTIYVRSPQMRGGASDLVHLERVVTWDPDKAEYEHNKTYGKALDTE